MVDEQFVPIMSTSLPAPEAVIELVKCSCASTKCGALPCKCYTNTIPCCELCACHNGEDDEETCLNCKDVQLQDDSDTNSDSDYIENLVFHSQYICMSIINF